MLRICVSALFTLCLALAARAQTAAFTYQGFLMENGAPANSTHDFEFKLYNAASAGTEQGGTLTLGDVGVTNGLFSVSLDFGSAPFDGAALWLDIAVRPGPSAGDYTILVPRQPITATPYALKAANAMTVTSGTISNPSFLGTTTTTAPLQLQVNNQVGLRLEYPTTGTVPNLVGGYIGNSVGAGTQGAVIAGGGASVVANSIGVDSDYSAIGGGFNNNIADNSWYATIAGGANNDIGTYSHHSTVGGGQDNNISSNSSSATIAGGFGGGIGVDSDYSAIGGGSNNQIADSSFFAFIAGGSHNSIGVNAESSAIGGGANNHIATKSFYATIAGGWANEIGVSSGGAAIGGGLFNKIAFDSFLASIAGGEINDIGVNSGCSAIGGGYDNNIASNAWYAVIPGGYLNAVGAGATNAFAAGYRAKADHVGAFVWADSQNADFASTANDQFSIRASGGLRLSDSTSMEFGSTGRQMLNLWSTNYGIGVQASSLYFRSDDSSANDGFFWYKGGSHTDGYAQPGAGGTELMHLVQGGLYVNGALVSTSDRNAKENFRPVDVRAVLEKVTALPLSRWNFKQDPSQQHVGPMAQDFHAAFGLGPDDKHIASVDADGVALAAIQGLNQKLTEELKRRDAENAELKARLERLEQLLK